MDNNAVYFTRQRSTIELRPDSDEYLCTDTAPVPVTSTRLVLSPSTFDSSRVVRSESEVYDYALGFNEQEIDENPPKPFIKRHWKIITCAVIGTIIIAVVAITVHLTMPDSGYKGKFICPNFL